MITHRKTPYEPGSWQEALHDTYLGILSGTVHSFRFMRTYVPFKSYLLSDEEGKAPLEDQGLKVVGVGYGRTGTYSALLALEDLGFPTLHTMHMYENNEIFEMWTNKVFLPSINTKEFSLGEPDLGVIASEGFKATMDLPMALYFEQIHVQYPECKFILTVRENSEVWFRSWETLTKSITQPLRYGYFLTRVRKLGYYIRWLFANVNNDSTYLTHPFPLPDQNKERAIKSYEEHNRRVREIIPSELLLEYNVKQGWGPLCKFLEIEECPTGPFPRTNSSHSVQVQAISSFVVPLVVVLFIVFTLFSVVFQRVTGKTVLNWVSVRRVRMLEALLGSAQKRKRNDTKRRSAKKWE